MVAKQSSLLARALAEFLGTFILVEAVSDVTIGGSPLGPLCVAAALMISIYCVGNISGGHLNPAVTLGVYIMSFVEHTNFSFKEFAVYVPSQLLGAFFAALVNTGIWHTNIGGASSTAFGKTQALTGNMEHPWSGKLLGADTTNTQAPDGGLVSVFLAELIFTAVLVFVVLNVATCGDEGYGMRNNYFGLAIGGVIAAGACAVGGISMGCFNPAVAFAVSFLNIIAGNLPDANGYGNGWAVGMFFYYTLAEIIGSLVACGLFAVCRKHQLGRKTEAGDDKTYQGITGRVKREPDMISKCLAEFIGTFVLCITIVLSIHNAQAMTTVGIASSLMVMIYALGPVSGGNFNPAVSLGLLCIGSIKVLDFVAYVVAQLLGGLLALLTSWLILQRIDSALVVKDVPANSPKFGVAQAPWFAIFSAEFIYTFMLVFTVLNVAVRDAPNQYFGLAIGFVVLVGATSLGSISGGAFNPAVALTLDFGGLIDNPYSQFGWGFLYALIQLLAGACAAGFYKLVSIGREDGGVMSDMLQEAEGSESEYEEE